MMSAVAGAIRDCIGQVALLEQPVLPLSLHIAQVKEALK